MAQALSDSDEVRYEILSAVMQGVSHILVATAYTFSSRAKFGYSLFAYWGHALARQFRKHAPAFILAYHL
jgi:hypothetical protein